MQPPTDDGRRELASMIERVMTLEAAVRGAALSCDVRPMLGATAEDTLTLLVDVIRDLRRERDEARAIASAMRRKADAAGDVLKEIAVECMSSNTWAASCVRIAWMIDGWEG